jgi:electron transfer flavoprotein beta subunit
MKILVCISKTPDTTAKIAFTDSNTKFDTNGVQWIINPSDEWYALVRAVELKEKDPDSSPGRRRSHNT